MIEQDIFIPYLTQGAVGEIRNNVRVLKESYDEAGIHLRVRISQKYLNKLKIDFDI